jgi:hypothetical protein
LKVFLVDISVESVESAVKERRRRRRRRRKTVSAFLS